MKMNLESHEFMRFKDMGLLKYYNLNLIEKQKLQQQQQDSSNRPYLNRTQKTANSENQLVVALNNDYVKLLEKQKTDLDHKDIELKALKQDNEKLKQQVDKLEKNIENINRILNQYQQQAAVATTTAESTKKINQKKILALKLHRGRAANVVQQAQRNAVSRAKVIKKLKKAAKKKKRKNSEAATATIEHEKITPRLSKLIAINSITHNNQQLSSTVIDDDHHNKSKNAKSTSSAKFSHYDEASNSASSITSFSTNYTSCESIPAASSSGKAVISVPTYREKSYTPLYRIEGTENITDENYLKRHTKNENEEKQIKKWDIRRQREEFERLKLLKGRSNGSNQKKNNNNNNLESNKQANLDDIESVEVVSDIEMNEIISKQQQTSMMSVYDDLDMDFTSKSSDPPPRKRAKNK